MQTFAYLCSAETEIITENSARKNGSNNAKRNYHAGNPG